MMMAICTTLGEMSADMVCGRLLCVIIYTNCRKRDSSEVFSFGDETPQNGNVLIACVACCSDSLIAFRVATGLFFVCGVCVCD